MDEKDLDFGAFNDDGSTQNDGSGTETPEVDTGAETHEDADLDALFAEDGGEDQGLFAPETDEGSAGKPDAQAATNAQLARLRKQRHELRSENQALSERVSATEAALESAKALGDAITSRYADHSNPAAAVGFDADFMDAMDRLAKSDPAVLQAAQKVRQAMEGKTFDTPAPKPQEDSATAELKAEVQQLRNERKTEKISELLSGLGVKDSMVSTVSKEVISRLEGEITRTSVKDAVLAASDDLGWTASDITNAKPKETKKDVPDPGKPRAAATAAKKETDSEGKPEAAKNMDEWKKNREAIFRSVEAG